MSESRKLLIGFGVVVLLCLCAAGAAYFAARQVGKRVEHAFNTDPTSIARARQNIAEFDIPPGYRPMTVSLFNYDMVHLIPEASSNGMTIMMMQYTGLASADRKQMEEKLRRSAEQQSSQPGIPMQRMETRAITVRGETVAVTISEGGYQGLIMRRWTTVFEGNKGPTLLMVQGPANAWDDQLLDDFLKSIH